MNLMRAMLSGRWLLLALGVLSCNAVLGLDDRTLVEGGTATAASGSVTGSGSSSGVASGRSSGGSTGAGSGSSAAAGTGSGAAAGMTSGSGSSTSGASSGITSGVSSGASSGSAGQTDAGSGPDMVPAGYAGTPFKMLTIPGTIYFADYDKGGAGVAYCINGTATGAACQNGTISDWCCGTMNGCDERAQPTVCPIYRADNDNAGLSHMNTGAPDDYAAAGPSWAAGAQGPTLTGPAVTAGTPVPQDAHTTTERDVYLSHTNNGEWAKYTVQVLEAGKYAVGGFMAVPPTTTISLNFGSGVTTGTFPVPASPCTWAGCPSTFHSWSLPSNLATVTFPVAGTYLMTFTIVNNALSANYFTFTKM